MRCGVGRASRQVVRIEMGLLRYHPPFSVQDDQRCEAIRVGELQNSVGLHVS